MKDEQYKAGQNKLRGRFDESAQPIVQVDVDKYQALLDGAEMTDAQKEEFWKRFGRSLCHSSRWASAFTLSKKSVEKTMKPRLTDPNLSSIG